MNHLAFAALWLFVATIPWQNAVLLAGRSTISQGVGIAALLLGLSATVARGQAQLRLPSAFLLLMIVYVGWAGASYFWSFYPSVTFRNVQTLIQLLGMVWLVWQVCQSRQQQRSLLQAYVLGCYLAAASTFYIFVTNAETMRRFAAAGSTPNWLAIGLALGIPMAWQLATEQRSGARYLLNLLYAPTALVAIVLAASRGGLIAASVALLIIPLTYGRLSIPKRLTLIALLLGVYYLAFLPLLESYPGLQRNLDRLSTISSELQGGDLNTRRDIWAAAGELALRYPVVGVGSGTFRYAVEGTLGYIKTSHNAFLSVLVETGLVGLVLFTLLIAVAATPLLLVASRERAFYAVLLLTLLVGLMPANLEVHKVPWLVLALMCAERAWTLEPAKRPLRLERQVTP